MLEALHLTLEWAILLTLDWQDHIIRTFLSVDIYVILPEVDKKNVLADAVVRCVCNRKCCMTHFQKLLVCCFENALTNALLFL